jgi:hypothetical protein
VHWAAWSSGRRRASRLNDLQLLRRWATAGASSTDRHWWILCGMLLLRHRSLPLSLFKERGDSPQKPQARPSVDALINCSQCLPHQGTCATLAHAIEDTDQTDDAAKLP